MAAATRPESSIAALAAAAHSAAAAPVAAAFTASMPRMPSFAFAFPKSRREEPGALAKSTPDQLAVYKKNFEALYTALQLKEAELAQLKVGKASMSTQGEGPQLSRRTTAHCPGLLGLALQAPGCATHSGRAADPVKHQWEVALRL